MSAARDFKGSYSPGGRTRRQKARENGRRGGLAAGVKRRQLARGRRQPHSRARAHALALAYRHKQLSRAQFCERYALAFPCPERGTAAVAWERGRETLLEHYRLTFRLYRAAGQHARTTNAQRGAALEAAHGKRCRRTIQRLNRKLEALGLAQVAHYKDQRDRPGHKDCLVVEIRTPPAFDRDMNNLACHPAPTEQPLPALRAGGRGCCTRKDQERRGDPPSSAPPAAPAEPPAAAINGDVCSDEGWEALRRRYFPRRRPDLTSPGPTASRLTELQARVELLHRANQLRAENSSDDPGGSWRPDGPSGLDDTWY